METVLISSLGRTVLGATKVTIGRAPDNTLVLSDANVSPYHAEIRPEGQYYTFVNFSHGQDTFVNEQLASSGAPRLLQPGDIIRIRDTKFTFLMDSGTQKAFSGEYQERPKAVETPLSDGINYPGSTAYGMRNDAGFQPPQGQPSVYPDIQGPPPPPLPLYGLSAQQSSHTSNHSGTPSPAPQRRPSPMKIASGVIAVILIVAGVSGFLLYHNHQVEQDHIQATTAAHMQAQQQATATVVAQQNTTGTAVARANTTATTIATSPYALFTKVALDDSLTAANTGWTANATCQGSAAGYQISIAQAGYLQPCLNDQSFGEMAYQVTMTIRQGDCGGLIFRHIDAGNFYIFRVCQDGTYNLGIYVHTQLTYLGTQVSSRITRGLGMPNLIAVTIQGNTINMYVNRDRVSTATSAALMTTPFNQGQVGLLALDTVNPTSVLYTNALVWTT